MALVTHLRCDSHFFSAARQPAGFINRPSQWLLYVNMFIQVHSRQRDWRVHVIGGGHYHGVNVFLALEHLAVILIVFRFRPVLGLQTNHPPEPLLGLPAIEFHWRPSRARLWIWLVKPRLQ